MWEIVFVVNVRKGEYFLVTEVGGEGLVCTTRKDRPRTGRTCERYLEGFERITNGTEFLL